MGSGGSKPEDLARIASEDAPYNPPLGPPNPVRPPFVTQAKFSLLKLSISL